MTYAKGTLFRVLSKFGGYPLATTDLANPYFHPEGSYVMFVEGFSLLDGVRTEIGRKGWIIRFVAANGNLVDSVDSHANSIESVMDAWLKLGLIEQVKTHE